jgi:predicted kinase
MKDLRLIMLIGPPGSGKSTWLKNNVINGEHHFIASTDSIIEELSEKEGLSYDEGFKRFIKVAEKEMKRGIREAIKDGKVIYWDQTNLTAKSRVKKLKMIPDKYSKQAIYFVVNEDELNHRLHNRAIKEGKSIPNHILRNMLASFEEPTLDEGFDVITKKEYKT